MPAIKRNYASVRDEFDEDERKAKAIADAKAREERACLVCDDMDHTIHLRCCYKGCRYHACATCSLKFGHIGHTLERTKLKCMLCKEYYQDYATPNMIRELLESQDNFQVRSNGRLLIKAGDEIMIATISDVASSVVTSIARPQVRDGSRDSSPHTGLFDSADGGGLFAQRWLNYLNNY
jgi:hypothetical protein